MHLQAGALASILQHLKLEIFSLKREEETLKDILVSVASILQKHAKSSTMRQCCLALSHCADSGGESLQVTGLLYFTQGHQNPYEIAEKNV